MMFNAFWSLDHCNFYLVYQAYLVLLYKKEDAVEIKDYRLISLIHSMCKMIAKVLSLRLVPHMQEMIHQNQSTFILGCTLHDNFKTMHATVYLLHAHRVSSILLKVYIAIAFDMVNWAFLLELMQVTGLSRRWINWMATLLLMVSTRIILNGEPGHQICHARGLR
jgi:hypothetical protein